jgi:hypothetical protein
MQKHHLFFMTTVLSLWVVLILIPDSMSASGASSLNCDPHAGPCTRTISGIKIQLEIEPKPVKAMETLTFRLTIADQPATQIPLIELGMPKMKMGPNKVLMRAIKKDVFIGKGIIVRCSSGKRVWKATVTVPGLGKADFIFHVIY